MRRKQVYPALFLLLFLASTVSWAVPQPLGTELKISSCDTCKKRSPAVAGIAIGAQAGVFLVAWESTSLTDPAGVSARFFLKTALPRATDLLVNRDAAPQQRGAVAAVDAQGNSVVAWAVSNGLNSDIMVQRYKPTGLANGAAFQVNTRPANVTTLDVAPAVAFAPNGSFVVAWTRSVPASATSPGATPVVMARLFKAAGTPLAPQVQLSTGLATGARPDVCVDTLGRAVVVWTIVDEYRPFEPSNFGVTARRIATNGAPLGGEILVAAPLAASSTAAVACGTGGQFVVAWSSNQAPATDGSDVLARRFTTAAAPLAPVFRVNSVTAGLQSKPQVAVDAKGNFVAVWQSHSDTTNTIVGRRFLASGAPDGADFIVHKPADRIEEWPISPDVAFLGPSTFIVVWTKGNSSLQGLRYRVP